MDWIAERQAAYAKENKMKGKVVRLVEAKGYGFISCEGKDYFFHEQDQINYDGLIPVGSEVEFEGRQTDRGLRAGKVRFLSVYDGSKLGSEEWER